MRTRTLLTPVLVAALLGGLAAGIINHTRPAWAATPASGALSAEAGTGGVTTKTFVKLSSAGVVVAATGVGDATVGICELTASAGNLTRYAPPGTQTTVTSGETIAVGDRLTPGASAKAYVLDANDAATQTVGAIALTAASGADEDVTVIVTAGTVEQHLALTALVADSAAIGGGYGSTGASISAAGVGQYNGALTTDGALTADSAVIGGGYGSTGATISTAGVGQFNGALTTDGALTADSSVIGGGYGSTGVTISTAGVIQANGAITSDGAITGGSLTDGTITSTAGAITGALDISGATVTYRAIVNADVSASAAIARSKLAEDALAVCGVPLTICKNADGTTLANAAAAGVFGITSGGFGSGTLVLAGEAASGNSKTNTLMFEFILPPSYVAAGDVKLVVTAKETVGAATVASTLSAEAYESDGEGAVGANLYNAFDTTDITTSWQTCTSVITAAGLAAGDRLVVFVRVVTNDTGGAVGTIVHIGKVELQCDIKG